MRRCVYCSQFSNFVGLCSDCVVAHSAGLCESRPGACDACKIIGMGE